MQQQFLNSLHLSDCNSVGLSLFKETAAKFVQMEKVAVHQPQLLDILQNLYNDSNIVLTSEKLALKCKSLSLTVTSAQVDFLETSTLQQADSVLWHEHRAGHITASAAHDALHTNLNQPAISILKKIITAKPEPIHATSLEHGRKAEKCVFEAVLLMRLNYTLTFQCHAQECEYVKMNHGWQLLLMASSNAAAMNAEC